MVPLHVSDFNRAKSNIGWIEAVHAGAITVAPDFQEWRRPGVINYACKPRTDLPSFQTAMWMALSMSGHNRAEELERARKAVPLERTVNGMRISVIKDLLKRPNALWRSDIDG
jgi:hypothetical protein